MLMDYVCIIYNGIYYNECMSINANKIKKIELEM
jgi:hypothetical protein